MNKQISPFIKLTAAYLMLISDLNLSIKVEKDSQIHVLLHVSLVYEGVTNLVSK